MQASVLGPASVDGVCGGSHARGNCMIALRLTRGYRKSGAIESDAENSHRICHRQVDIRDVCDWEHSELSLTFVQFHVEYYSETSINE